MGVISTELCNQTLDMLVQAYVKALGTAGTGYGMGEPEGAFGAADAMVDLRTLLASEGDPQAHCGRAAETLQDALSSLSIVGSKSRAFIAALNRHARQFGGANYSSLETLLQYRNAGGGGTWAALQDYRWRDLYNAMFGGSTYPEEYNLYCEILQGATFTQGMGGFAVSGAGAGVYTDAPLVSPLIAGSSVSKIDNSKFAGGIPQLVVSGLAGNGLVTVTGIGYDPATKAITASVTWTVTVTANGTWYFTGGTAPANALIIDVTNIGIAAGITAGQLYVNAQRPPLRSGTVGADTVTATTVGLDDNASSENDFYVGLQIGTNADNYTLRTISAYDGNTKVATVSVAWATNPTASTSLYRVLRKAIS